MEQRLPISYLNSLGQPLQVIFNIKEKNKLRIDKCLVKSAYILYYFNHPGLNGNEIGLTNLKAPNKMSFW